MWPLWPWHEYQPEMQLQIIYIETVQSMFYLLLDPVAAS